MTDIYSHFILGWATSYCLIGLIVVHGVFYGSPRVWQPVSNSRLFRVQPGYGSNFWFRSLILT